MEPCVITTNLSEVSPHYPSGNMEDLDGRDELYYGGCQNVWNLAKPADVRLRETRRDVNEPVPGCEVRHLFHSVQTRPEPFDAAAGLTHK